MQCVVIRAFSGPAEREYVPGELVDASAWRLQDKLISQRYMRPATESEIKSAVEVDDAPMRPRLRKGKKL